MKIKREGGFLISKIHQISGRVFSRKLKKKGIDFNPAQGRILFVLWKEDGIKINELAKRTSLSKTSLTTMLERLERQGHIRRIQSKQDRRSIIISLTEKNKQQKDLYEKISLEMTELFYKGFTDEDMDKFENSLRKILNNLDNNE
jgi:DNA-binding MarR family transcriptional regulator